MILGITASHGLGARAGGDFESISTVTVGAGGQSTITFSSIPQTYTHLQIRGIARSNSGSLGVNLKFNSDAATNYSQHSLEGNGSTASSAGNTTSAPNYMTYMAPSTYTANVFAVGVIDILDYTNINKYKTVKSLAGVDNNGSGVVALLSENWRSTNAITTIDLIPQGSNSFVQYSTFALYGIKAA